MIKTIGQFTSKLPTSLSIPPPHSLSSATAVLLLSNTFPQASIQAFHKHIFSLFPHTNLIGAVVDGIGSRSGWSLSVVEDSRAFVSLPGRVRRAKAVGRWHARDEVVDRSGTFKSVSTSAVEQQGDLFVPSQLQDWKAKETAFITLSDKEPYDLYGYLEKTFPSSTKKMGLIAAQTPFLNGHPFTLFYNGAIIDGGSVGIAMSRKISSKTDYSCLYSLSSEPMKITKCQGNIILELDGVRASNKLVSEVYSDKATSTDTRLFCEVIDGDSKAILVVTGGDTSKGTLALETLGDLKVGSKIRFMKRKPDIAPETIHDGDTSGCKFRMLTQDFVPPQEQVVDFGGSAIVGGSQLGVIDGSEASLSRFQICSVPGMNQPIGSSRNATRLRQSETLVSMTKTMHLLALSSIYSLAIAGVAFSIGFERSLQTNGISELYKFMTKPKSEVLKAAKAVAEKVPIIAQPVLHDAPKLDIQRLNPAMETKSVIKPTQSVLQPEQKVQNINPIESNPHSLVRQQAALRRFYRDHPGRGVPGNPERDEYQYQRDIDEIRHKLTVSLWDQRHLPRGGTPIEE